MKWLSKGVRYFMVKELEYREIKDTIYSIRDTAKVLEVALNNVWNILNKNPQELDNLISQCSISIEHNQLVIELSESSIDDDFKTINIERLDESSKLIKSNLIDVYLKPSMNSSIENYGTFVKQKCIANDLTNELISNVQTLETKINFFKEYETGYF